LTATMPSAVQKSLLTLLRVAWLVALVFSVALYVHYLDPANSGYCSGRSGCEAVRRSAYSYFLGQAWLNLPLLGVVSFSAAFTLSMVPLKRPLRSLLLGSAALLGGCLAAVFVGLQALVIDAYCWLCMVVDSSAIVAGVFGALLIAKRNVQQSEPLTPWATASIAGLLALAPVGLWQFRPGLPIPEGVAKLYVPGKINVVEFADFECPYCRTMHPILARLNREYGDRVNFHQLHMPLPGHPHSMSAAAAAVCAENVGKGHEMKDLLFTRALDERAPREHAQALGLDLETFDHCVNSAATVRRIEEDKEIILNGGFRGLPTTFVGDQRLVGWRVYPALKEAYEAAAAGGGKGIVLPPWLFLTLVGATALGLGVLGRAGRNRLATS
jgi:protein-disulfide isomerase